MNDQRVREVSKMIHLSGCLNHLEIKNVCVTEEGIKYIAFTLKATKTLQCLELSEPQIKDEDLKMRLPDFQQT